MIPTFVSHNKEFLFKPRHFATVEEMNEAIVKNWNNIVTNNDTVYLLGDVMLNNNEEGINCLKQLNGNLHIIRGNHCTDQRISLYKECPNVLDVQNSAYLHYNGLHFYLTHYPTLTSNFDYDKPLKARLINFCGHSHIQDPFADWDRYNAPIYHCELDAHNNTPVSIEKIISDLYRKIES